MLYGSSDDRRLNGGPSPSDRNTSATVIEDIVGETVESEEENRAGSSVILKAGLTFLLGAVVSGVMFFLASHGERQNLRMQFDRTSLTISVRLESELARVLDSVVSLKSFFDSAPDVDREQFRQFVRQAFRAHPSVKSFAWIPRVLDSDRAGVERFAQKEAQKENFTKFQFIERGAEGQFVKAEKREEYFPFLYLENADKKPAPLLGYNIGSDASLLRLLQEARDQGLASVSPPLSLTGEAGTEDSVMFVVPVFRANEVVATMEGRRRALIGYLAGFVSVEELVRGFSSELDQNYTLLYVYDKNAQSSQRILLDAEKIVSGQDVEADLRFAKQHGLKYIRTFAVAGNREWTFVFLPRRGFFGISRTWQSKAILGTALMASAILSLIVYVISRMGGTKELGHMVHSVVSGSDDHSQIQNVEALYAEIRELRDSNENWRAKVQKAEELQSTFLSLISHELRSPINGILGMNSLLLDTELSDEQREYLTLARSSGETLLRAVNDILDMSQIQSSTLKLDNVEFDLQELWSQIIAVCDIEAQAKGLELVDDFGIGVPKRIRGDSTRLRQILSHLISNAIKFTNCRGGIIARVQVAHTLDATISPTSLRLQFSVSDSGIGIPEDQRERIFMPFWTGAHLNNQHKGGFGLGLALCSHLVKMMGGSIGVRSMVGIGSCFSFVAEVAMASRETSTDVSAVIGTSTFVIDEQPAKSAADVLAEERKLRILIAETNVVNQRLAQRLLEQAGHISTGVSSGVEAMELFQKGDFDLVLLDIELPDIDVKDMQLRIKSRADMLGHKVPVIALIGEHDTEHEEQLRKQGMDACVSKPYEKRALFEAVELALHRV